MGLIKQVRKDEGGLQASHNFDADVLASKLSSFDDQFEDILSTEIFRNKANLEKPSKFEDSLYFDITNDDEGDRNDMKALHRGGDLESLFTITPLSRSTSSEEPKRNTDLIALAALFTSQVEVKNRTHRLKTYKQSFIGSDAVDYLCQSGKARSREEAVKLGRSLEAMKLFEPFTKGQRFGDEYTFFHFTDLVAPYLDNIGLAIRPARKGRRRYDSESGMSPPPSLENNHKTSRSRTPSSRSRNVERRKSSDDKINDFFKGTGAGGIISGRSSLLGALDSQNKHHVSRATNETQRRSKSVPKNNSNGHGRRNNYAALAATSARLKQSTSHPNEPNQRSHGRRRRSSSQTVQKRSKSRSRDLDGSSHRTSETRSRAMDSSGHRPARSRSIDVDSSTQRRTRGKGDLSSPESQKATQRATKSSNSSKPATLSRKSAKRNHSSERPEGGGKGSLLSRSMHTHSVRRRHSGISPPVSPKEQKRPRSMPGQRFSETIVDETKDGGFIVVPKKKTMQKRSSYSADHRGSAQSNSAEHRGSAQSTSTQGNSTRSKSAGRPRRVRRSKGESSLSSPIRSRRIASDRPMGASPRKSSDFRSLLLKSRSLAAVHLEERQESYQPQTKK